MKIDINTKTFTEWGEDKCYPSEPVFVPNPNGTDEDDGKAFFFYNFLFPQVGCRKKSVNIFLITNFERI
jgi:hypothetical protein